MDLTNDPIAAKAEAEIKALERLEVNIAGGSSYNRVFEAFYNLHKIIAGYNAALPPNTGMREALEEGGEDYREIIKRLEKRIKDIEGQNLDGRVFWIEKHLKMDV